MPSRYLFGPVTAEFAEQNLHRARRAGDCLAFNSLGNTDLAITATDTWEAVLKRLPQAWEPDYVVLNLSHATAAPCVWTAPLPIVGLAGAWSLCWHAYHSFLRRCELVLTDVTGAEALVRDGMTQTRSANLFGYGEKELKRWEEAKERDIDVLFVGNMHPAVQCERLALLGRLARLADRRRVTIRTGVSEEEYSDLLARARIVVNHSSRGVCNRRVWEALASGALLFQEAGNREIRDYLTPDAHCVLYTEEDVEDLLEYYLEREEQRRQLAEASRAQLPRLCFDVLWNRALEQVSLEWPRLVQRRQSRPELAPLDEVLGRAQQQLSSGQFADTRLIADLAAMVASRPHEAALHNALGLIACLPAQAGERLSKERTRSAAGYFRRAVDLNPQHILAGLNLAEALLRAGASDEAAEQALRVLALLEKRAGHAGDSSASPGWLGEAHFPPWLDVFRVEWERAAWQHAGRPRQQAQAKFNLVRWRLHTLLAEISGDLGHYHGAALARPDLPVSRAALGCALARAGRFAEAAAQLRIALGDNPFDLAAARALYGALTEIGDMEDRQRLVRGRRLLHQAAPKQVRAEKWFAAEEPSAGQPGRMFRAPAGTAPVSEMNVTPDRTIDFNSASGPRARVSLCMIGKNEENNLAACLASIADLMDEVVVVDTGSSDRTKEIARGYTSRVVDFPWLDSFAAARNASVEHASGAWIFWLDADDRVDEENRSKLRRLFADLKDENAAYVMKCFSPAEAGSGTATMVDHVRLFRNHPDIRWKYRVHEQILLAIRRAGGDVRWSDVVIQHAGYQDRALRARKLQRDLRLLHLENAEHPDDPFTLFNLGSVFQELGRPTEALPLLRRSLERSHVSDSIVRKLYSLLASCHRQLGQTSEALSACRSGLRHYPEDAELLFCEGSLLRQQGDRHGAETAWLRLLGSKEKPHFASLDAGLRGPKVRQNLAALCHEEGRYAEAEAQWRALLAEEPDFHAAWLGLAELYFTHERWSEFADVLAHLESQPQWTVDATVLRGRCHLARKEFAQARQLLTDAVARAPQAVWPRVILSHVLLQEGQDWPAAEQTLREILALDPANIQARGNLGILLKQIGKVVG